MSIYFSLGDKGHLGMKVIYFKNAKSSGFSYWANKESRGDIQWKFKEVLSISYARKIKRSTAKRYIKHIP